MTKRFATLALAGALLVTTGIGCGSVSAADQEKLATMNATVEVVRVKEAVEPGTPLTPELVETVSMPSAFLPPSPVLAADLAEWEGQELQLKVEAGRILEGRDFMAPAGATTAGGVTIPKTEEVVKVDGAPVRKAPNGKAEAVALATGYEAYTGILRIAPGAAVPEHADETEEFIYVLSGAGTLTIDGTDYEVGPQMLIYMPAGATVSFKNGDAPMEVFQVFAGPEPASKYETWTAAE